MKQEIKFKGVTLKRIDTLNWALTGPIIPGKKKTFYYGRLIDALKDLPHKAMNQFEFSTLEEILKAYRQIQDDMESLKFTKFDA